MGRVTTVHTAECHCAYCGIRQEGPTQPHPQDVSMNPSPMSRLRGWGEIAGREACFDCLKAFEAWKATRLKL